MSDRQRVDTHTAELPEMLVQYIQIQPVSHNVYWDKGSQE